MHMVTKAVSRKMVVHCRTNNNQVISSGELNRYPRNFNFNNEGDELVQTN